MTSTANAFATLDGKKIPIYKNYTEKSLREAVNNGIFENVPALVRSEDEHLHGKNTGVNQVVGSFTNVKWNNANKQVEGILNLKSEVSLQNTLRRSLGNWDRWQNPAEALLDLASTSIWQICHRKLKDKYVAVVTEIESLQSIDRFNQEMQTDAW
jgi:hypothetical protein